MSISVINDYIIHTLFRRFFNKYDFSSCFRFLDQTLKNKVGKSKICKPIFIIGLPRSGTTLLYQMLLNRYCFSYFSVFVSFFPSTPLFAYAVQNKIISQPKSLGYNSAYGRVQNRNFLTSLFAPSEGHPVFNKYFDMRENHEYAHPLPESKSNALKEVVNGISVISGFPFINKNPRNSLRIIPLISTFSEASFIIVKRDLFYIAQSLYIARQQATKGKKNKHISWWGTKFNGYKSFSNLSSVEQSAYQAKILSQKLFSYIHYIKNSHIVDYKAMCNNPEQTLDDIELFLEHNSIPIRANIDSQVTSIKSSDTLKISDRDANIIHNILMGS